MLRVMAVLMRPVNPTLARQIQVGVVMNAHDMSFDPSDTDRPIRRSRLLAWQRWWGGTTPVERHGKAVYLVL
jgi:hypothetical protein